ncbi:choline/ethanolamine transporter flvcr2b isoform X2 [Cardiocondyla obscurior]|uniref:choline/ethanolamine transporter flvcr2b isoform X2 n=1 Tax=Cardiocondyla obscurior TaxID=286306 RepID=UPI0039656585
MEAGHFPSISFRPQEIRVYKRRWQILILFVVYSASNAMQWIQYSIISNIIMKYYNVSDYTVDMTSMIYMITYIPLIFPASYLLDKFGLRWTVITGAFGTAIGSWIKVLSLAPDRFWVTFVGQTVVAVSQTCILSVPARLAAVWFGDNEVSRACGIGVFGNQLGIAIGFLFPPMLVPSKEICDIEQGLQRMFYIVAAITSFVLILILLLFKSAPPLPPSIAQAEQREKSESSKEVKNFLSSIRRLLSNRGYLLLLFSYGINVGTFYAISTLLNRLIVNQFRDGEEDAGRIGLTIVCTGMVGSIVCGILLDKTHKFWWTTVGVYICSLLGMIIFTFTLDQNVGIYVIYITAGILGFFMTGYLPVGFELAAELTFPEPEGTSTGLLNAVVQIFGIAFTPLYRYLLNIWEEDLWANVALCGILAVGVLLTILIPNDLRRQNAKLKA